ncbi:hypothetical protein AB1Y20_023110 [Prymnesium parvum]|uniref:Uncharacterized protein n=1 Tax=Prymnesium parvum TaxID=97485 RepID=A0AB34JDF7_PRYPA
MVVVEVLVAAGKARGSAVAGDERAMEAAVGDQEAGVGTVVVMESDVQAEAQAGAILVAAGRALVAVEVAAPALVAVDLDMGEAERVVEDVVAAGVEADEETAAYTEPAAGVAREREAVCVAAVAEVVLLEEAMAVAELLGLVEVREAREAPQGGARAAAVL